jgi:hypothetical protein
MDAYSNLERTRAMYVVLRHSIGECFTFLLRNPRVELAPLQMYAMWLDHVRSCDIRTLDLSQRAVI